jgi:hypothetical protein
MIILGRDVIDSHELGMSRRLPDGTLRALTNIEMSAALSASHEAREVDRRMERWLRSFAGWVSRGCPLHEEFRYD